MNRERERMRFHDRIAGEGFNFENWVAQNEIVFRDRTEERRNRRSNLEARPPLEVRRRPLDLDLFQEDPLEDDLAERIVQRVREEGRIENQAEVDMMVRLEELLLMNANLARQQQ